MRSNIMALQQRRADLAKKCKSILDTASIQNRELSTEEAAQYERTMGSIRETDAQIIEQEAQIARDMQGTATIDENMLFAAAAMRIPLPQGPSNVHVTRGKRTYASIFGEARDSGGFSSLQDFFRCVQSSDKLYDPRLGPFAAGSPQNTTVPSLGGFLVPEAYAQRLLDTVTENQIVFPRAQIWEMKSDTLRIPGIDDADHSGGVLLGGIASAWAAELQELDLANIKTWQLQLTCAKFALLAQSSNELADDGINFEQVLTSKLEAGASFHLDVSYLSGDGSQGKPVGALNSGNPARILVNKETSPAQGSGTFIYKNTVNMYSALHPSCRANAVWVISSDLLPQLLEMVFPVYNQAGSDIVGGIPPQVVSTDADGTYRLLGLPVIQSEKLSAAGSEGDVTLCDFSQYAIGLRKQITVERSRDAGFTSDSTFWRLIVRVAAQSSWKSAIKGRNGKLQSPFIVLQAR